jgi:hypothetical protein
MLQKEQSMCLEAVFSHLPPGKTAVFLLGYIQNDYLQVVKQCCIIFKGNCSTEWHEKVIVCSEPERGEERGQLLPD